MINTEITTIKGNGDVTLTRAKMHRRNDVI